MNHSSHFRQHVLNNALLLAPRTHPHTCSVGKYESSTLEHVIHLQSFMKDELVAELE